MQESICSQCISCQKPLCEGTKGFLFCLNERCKRYGFYTAIVEPIKEKREENL